MNHPKYFVVQFGALLAMYACLSSLLFVIFGIITVLFPNVAGQLYEDESARSSIRTGIAMLIVFFPTYLALMRVSNHWRRVETDGEYSTLSKWLIYLSVLVGGGVLLGDLVAVILGALEGDLTLRFLLKAGTLFLVAGATLSFYVLDLRGYFKQHSKHALYFAYGATVVVLGTVVCGFMQIESPEAIRQLRLDETTVRELDLFRWQIEDYYQQHKVLPVEQALTLPETIEGRRAFEYRVTGSNTYELCAEFSAPTPESEMAVPKLPEEKNYTWNHEAGWQCFDRTVVQE